MRGVLSQLRTHSRGLMVGAIVTLVAGIAQLANVFEPISLWMLDRKFRTSNRVSADPAIVMIDINDYALERVHRWPWPRSYHSDLIRTLTELGARAVLMDIVFDTPSGGRVDDARLDPDYDIDSGELFGTLDELNVVYDDREFADALRDAGDVYLAMFARLYKPGYSPDALRASVYELLKQNPTISASEADARLGGQLSAFAAHAASGRRARHVTALEVFDGLRIERALEGTFQLDLSEIAEQLSLASRFVETHLAAAKRTVARRLVRGFLETHHDATFADVFRAFMPGSDINVFSSDREDLRRAFRAISSERNVVDKAIPVNTTLAGRIPHAVDLSLPVEQFTAAARVGVVTFETDSLDGVMRRVPLLIDARGRLLEHLGFALACDVLDIDESSIRIDDGNVLTMSTRDGDASWRVPIDRDGMTLINWHIDRVRHEWWGSFTHIPVFRVWLIPKLRAAIEEEQGVLAHQMQEFVRFTSAGADAALATYQSLVRERRRLRHENESPESSGELALLDRRIAKIEQTSVDYVVNDLAPQVRELLAAGEALSADNPDDAQALEALRLADKYATDPGGRRLKQAIAAKRTRIEELQAELTRRIGGKICLVGYTAAAVADTVNTPVFDEMPGVLAHANVINSMLTNRFPRIAPPWFNVLVVVLAGMFMGTITALRNPWVSLVCVVAMTASLLVAEYAAFFFWVLDIDLAGAAIGVFVTWAAVTLYRQLTEERQKRAFSKSLAQYTSPAIAAKLATQLSQRGGAMDLSPVPRSVTCFFSDLKGFTSISERLGASRTRDVLNPYLDAMSAVLIEENAMINKFMGDGIFAFFNPPVLPVEDHPSAGCESALRSFDALEQLKQRLGQGSLADEVRALSMRIGLNTGDVFVGDYGSDNKLDYTCIGDTVNLAARLEPACKVFGVQCLISQSTLSATDDRFVVRHLGGLQVVGKKEAVQVYELVGRRGEVDDAGVRYAELFGRAVASFQARQWDETARLLNECAATHPDDQAVRLLADNVRAFRDAPPPDDWNQAIQLTSK